jgi:hypothetical protein
MDPVMLVIVPGFLGGLVIAVFIITRQRKPDDGVRPLVFRENPLSTDVINMARIKVAGVGGLGLVAVSVVVSLFMPSIRRPVTVSLILGVLFGAILILRRRRAGPMPSSGRRPGANTTLAIDAVDSPSDGQEPDSSNVQMQGPPAVRAVTSAVVPVS